MLSRFKLSTRIMILGITIVVAFAALFGWLYPKIKGDMYEAKYLKTRHVVETAYSVVSHFSEQAQKGALSTEEAQAQAKAAVEALRYESKDYFWINDMTPRMIMHPMKPQLNGKDLSGVKDPDGIHLFVEMVKA